MPVHLPSLGIGIELLSVCCWLDPKAPKIAARFNQDGKSFLESKYADGSQFIQLMLESASDGDIHCHVNIARRRYFKNRRHKPKNLVELERLTDLLAGYIGFKAEIISVSGEFRIARRSMPRNGMVQTISGVAVPVGGSTLKIEGVDLSINEAPYSKLNWKVEKTVVFGTLTAIHRSVKLTDDCLLSAESTVGMGIERYLLEKDESHNGD